MASPTPSASERSDRAEWLQSPTRILVRRRSRLGRWYYVLRPLAIAYSIFFRALREVLALLVWIALWVYWIGWRVLAMRASEKSAYLQRFREAL
jgi:Mg2+ and Co2+ transporter CorA